MRMSVLAEADRGHTVLTMRNWESRNGLDAAAVAAITSALDDAEGSDGSRAFVITADGPTFCSGMRLGPDVAGWLADDMAPLRTLFTRMVDSPLVTIALVDGAAIGGGVGLASVCDQVIAGPRASFRLTETLLGLIPALVLPVLARRTGQQTAFSLALNAEAVDADDAVRLGLADLCAADTADALRRLLIRLRRADKNAIRALKRYRSRLYPLDFGPPGIAAQALGERFADPASRERLARLRAEGMIS